MRSAEQEMLAVENE